MKIRLGCLLHKMAWPTAMCRWSAVAPSRMSSSRDSRRRRALRTESVGVGVAGRRRSYYTDSKLL